MLGPAKLWAMNVVIGVSCLDYLTSHLRLWVCQKWPAKDFAPQTSNIQALSLQHTQRSKNVPSLQVDCQFSLVGLPRHDSWKKFMITIYNMSWLNM